MELRNPRINWSFLKPFFEEERVNDLVTVVILKTITAYFAPRREGI